MNRQQLHDVLKAYANGSTPEQVANIEEINVDEAKKIYSIYFSKIEEIRVDLKNGGFSDV